MNCFISAEVGFSEKLTPAVSPSFQKAKMGERTGRLSPKCRFLEFGGGRRGAPSWIVNIINFNFRITDFMSFQT